MRAWKTAVSSPRSGYQRFGPGKRTVRMRGLIGSAHPMQQYSGTMSGMPPFCSGQRGPPSHRYSPWRQGGSSPQARQTA